MEIHIRECVVVRGDRKDTPKEARFRAACRGLLEQGIKPTPMELYRRFPDERFVNEASGRRGPTLSGSLSTIRIEEFERAGWTQPKYGGKWEKK